MLWLDSRQQWGRSGQTWSLDRLFRNALALHPENYSRKLVPDTTICKRKSNYCWKINTTGHFTESNLVSKDCSILAWHCCLACILRVQDSKQKVHSMLKLVEPVTWARILQQIPQRYLPLWFLRLQEVAPKICYDFPSWEVPNKKYTCKTAVLRIDITGSIQMFTDLIFCWQIQISRYQSDLSNGTLICSKDIEFFVLWLQHIYIHRCLHVCIWYCLPFDDCLNFINLHA